MCNAHNHNPSCTCGWGGDGHQGRAGWKNAELAAHAPTNALWSFRDSYCNPSICPECRSEVFFIRHNGGSVWLNELGWPWTKHECMDSKAPPSWSQYFEQNAFFSKGAGFLIGIVTRSLWIKLRGDAYSKLVLYVDSGDQGSVAIAIDRQQSVSYYRGEIMVIDIDNNKAISSKKDILNVVITDVDWELEEKRISEGKKKFKRLKYR